jgi:hypothetical protein
MNTNNLSSEINNNSGCEALNCYEKATERVIVKVGDKGRILLSLCKKCSLMFSSINDENVDCN